MSIDINRLKNIFIELSEPFAPLPTDTEPVLQTLHDIRFVIFDFYGTLFISGVGDIGIDGNSQDTTLFAEILEFCGFKADPEVNKTALRIYDEVVNRHQERLKRQGYDVPEPTIDQVWLEVLNKLQSDSWISGPVDLQTARRFAVEFEARMNPIWPMPGLNDMLDILRNQKVETGIISNSQFYTPLAFETLMDQRLEEMGFNPGLLHWSFEQHLKKPSTAF